jgi:SUMO ligase MMS21 Smc5/6 complex component
MHVDERLIRQKIEEAEARRTNENLSDFERHLAAGAKAALVALIEELSCRPARGP